MAARLVTVADVQAVGDVDGLTKLLDKLGYDTSVPTEQTAAALGVAEKGQAMVREARRIVAQKARAGPLPALEIYGFEVTSLTAELRRMLASAFRNKPLLRYLLVLTQRDFSQLDFVLVEKSIAEAAAGTQVAVTHQLFSVDVLRFLVVTTIVKTAKAQNGIYRLGEDDTVMACERMRLNEKACKPN